MPFSYERPLCARSGRSCRRRNGMAGGQDHARGADISVRELRANKRHCVSRETILQRRTCGRRRRRRPAPPQRPRQSLSACPFGLSLRPHKPHQLPYYQPLEQRAGAIVKRGETEDFATPSAHDRLPTIEARRDSSIQLPSGSRIIDIRATLPSVTGARPSRTPLLRRSLWTVSISETCRVM
jgi:hypothetical protein